MVEAVFSIFMLLVCLLSLFPSGVLLGILIIKLMNDNPWHIVVPGLLLSLILILSPALVWLLLM